jgi:hypothetical protein
MELKLWVSFFRKVDSSEENLFASHFKFSFEKKNFLKRFHAMFLHHF